MQLTREWAALRGFDYHFVDDRLFDLVPPWYRERVQGNILLVSDLARLVVAQGMLASGYDRAIWVDADMLIFDPERLVLPITEEYAFCLEFWLHPGKDGKLTIARAVNNSVSLFVKGNSFLEFYIHACLQIAGHNHTLDTVSVGTKFLTSLRNIYPFRLIEDVGTFSPPVMHALVTRNEALEMYRKALPGPIFAANLCGSLGPRNLYDYDMTESVYEKVIDRCLETRGQIINSA